MSIRLAKNLFSRNLLGDALYLNETESDWVLNSLDDSSVEQFLERSTPADVSKTRSNSDRVNPELPALNYFRYEEILPDLFFVSVDCGDWLFLTGAELRAVQQNRFSGELKDKLERSFVVLTERNINNYVERIRARYFFVNEGPTLHIVVVTRRCNLGCIYCQAAGGVSQQESMDMLTACSVIDKAVEAPAKSLIVEFQGGEPLLNFPAVHAAILRAEQRAADLGKRIEFSIISNFTEVVSEDKLRFLLEHNVSMCVSLDGPQELHDLNRSRKGCFETVRSNIDLYRRVWASVNRGPVVLKALLTTTRPTMSYHREIIDTYLECGINLLSIRPLTPVGRAKEPRPELQYSAQEFIHFWQALIQEVLDRRRRGVNIREFHMELLLQKLFANETGYMDLRSPCGASVGQIVYNVDGSIYCCDEGRMLDSDAFRIGHLSDPSLSHTLRSRKARQILDASVMEQYYCDYCAFKPFCGVCPVLHFVDSGHLTTDVLSQKRCAIYGGMLRHLLTLYATSGNARQMFGQILEQADW